MSTGSTPKVLVIPISTVLSPSVTTAVTLSKPTSKSAIKIDSLVSCDSTVYPLPVDRRYHYVTMVRRLSL